MHSVSFPLSFLLSFLSLSLLPSPFPQVSDLIIPTVETCQQRFFLETYMTHEMPLLFVGPTGTGKSAITNNYLVQLPKDMYVLCVWCLKCGILMAACIVQ